MRVLVAPDKFKGTLTAPEAAEAIATGWRRGDPSSEIEIIPMADGGEGTLEALVSGVGGERFRERVAGPLDEPVDAEFAVVRAPEGPTGVVEMARASGLELLPTARRDPRRTTTRGTGELILAACRRGARRVLVCIGGSATNDAGAGMAQALGVRLLDREGRQLRSGGAALLELSRIDVTRIDPLVRDVEFVAATDVDNPLVGPRGASAVYGPQKGASPEDVHLLDEALRHFAAVVYRDLGVDIRDMPGAGAAGGLGGGLVAFLGARLRSGVDVVMEAVRLKERMQGIALVITGEGAFDEQSLRGKAPAGVLRMAEELRIPAMVLCGEQRVDRPGTKIWSLAERFGREAARERARQLLAELAAEAARETRMERVGGQGG
ncbi:MAG TPA: glycerate kinase [Actinomycetota bacterium]|nr:glycerate kinase [Actinomycetota bacterium]